MPILFGTAIREKLLSGVEQLANVVAITLGPKGRNVCLEKAFGSPLVTKDGVSVAKEVELPDPWENLGARLVREVASKTSDDAGDGTTTATVLAYSMLSEAHRLIAAGYSPTSLQRGMLKVLAYLEQTVYDQSFPVRSQEDIEHVATVSANGDSKLGKIIAEAVAKVGKDGVVNIEEGKGTDITVEATDGLRIDRGYLSPEFKTHPEENCSILENPFIFVTDMVLTTINQLVPVLEQIVPTRRPVLWIAPDFDGEALKFLCQNFGAKVLISQLVKAPSFGAQQAEILKDIAAVTGATFITKELGMTFKDVVLEHFGSARTVRITDKTTTLVDGAGSQEVVGARVEYIQAQVASSGSEYDREKLQERLGKLLGGVCSIKVGAASEVELKEIKGRLEDALYAIRAAVEDGLVPGGGTALLRASVKVQNMFYGFDPFAKTLEEYPFPVPADREELLGWNLVLKSCVQPFARILLNAGEECYQSFVEKILESDDEMFGLDVSSMELCNLKSAGILDPTKVVLAVITNSTSLVGTMLTTETGILKISKQPLPTV